MQEFIYTITCKVNGKVYVGRTCNHHRRKREHFKKLSQGTHHNKHLQASYNKHGSDSFNFSVVEEATKDVIKERELFWFNKLSEDGVTLFNHDITSSSGGIDSRRHITRTYIFDILTERYNTKAGLRTLAKKHNTSTATLLHYIPEWEELTGLKMFSSPQTAATLERISEFVKDFRVVGKGLDYNEYGISHQALVKHLPKFGLSFDEVRLDDKFKTTRERTLKAIEEVRSGAKIKAACTNNDVSITTFYKYLKEIS